MQPRDKLETHKKTMTGGLIIRAGIATLLVPGTVVLLIPYFILHRTGFAGRPEISFLSVLSIIIAVVGLIALLHSIWGFVFHGSGTLAPVDPPGVLVISGLYRHTRNPMYLAVVLVLLSEAVYFRSPALFIYAAAAFLIFHFFVVFYEEPRLLSRFGREYQRYFEAVPRWRIKVRGFSGDRHGVSE